MSRKRIDGIGKLTPAQKAERDARAQHWMNCKAMETVYLAAIAKRIEKMLEE